MSRTFRRKNYESCYLMATPGFKYGGFFTMVKRAFTKSEFGKYPGPHLVYKAPTREEYLLMYWNIHGESKTSSSFGANRYYKKHKSKQHRKNAKNELKKYNLFNNYEVMLLSNNKTDDWYW